MKYARLTKEQFEELHPEFVNFLATQSIDKSEWDQIKETQPAVVEQELDVFSDLIWEGVLTRAAFLEHFSKKHIFLFHCLEATIHSLLITSLSEDIDFLTTEGLKWMGDNLFTENTEIKVGSKAYDGDRNQALFSLIQQGAFLSDGQLYKQINSVIQS